MGVNCASDISTRFIITWSILQPLTSGLGILIRDREGLLVLLLPRVTHISAVNISVAKNYVLLSKQRLLMVIVDFH